MKRTLLVCAVFSVSLCDGLAAANVQQTSHKAACAIKVTDYGASGDDRNLDSEPIQRAIDDCARLGGGEVRFPRGVYRVGTLHLRSNVSVVLEEGSVLRGSEDLDDYLEPLTRNGVDKSHFVSGTGSRRLFLYGDHVENVSIRGKGTIDGNQVREKSGTRGPLTILIQHSSNVVLDGITVTRSPGWSVTFFDCQHVRVLGVKLKDVMADGINPVSCQDVLYDGVVIDGTGDDPICIKNEGPPLRGGYVTRDVTIRNTVVRNTSHPGFKIGTGTNGTFDRVVVEDSTFERVGDLFAIQLMRPSQTGEAERFIRNIWMRRVRASNTKRFLDITAIGVGQPVISGVHFEDVQIDGRVVGSRILGTNASPIEDITIRNVVAVANESSESWLQTRNVGRLTLDHVTIDVPGTKTILAADTGRGLKLDSIRVRGLLPDGPALHLADVQDAEIGTITTPHLKNLVWVAGARAAKIRLKQADWSQVENPLLAADDVAEQALLPAANAKVLSLSAPARIKPNEALQVNAQVQNAGPAGVTPLTLFAGDRVAGRKWIWIGTAGKKTVTITGNPFYVPGSYALNLGGFVRKLRVMRTPAHFQYGTFCEMDTPAAPGATTKVVVPVRNIGGTTGKHVVELKVSGKPFVSKEVTLGPGEETRVSLEHVFQSGGPHSLQAGDFPEWRFATFRNVPGRFLLYRDRFVIEAGGRPGERNDYGAIYFKDVTADFDAKVRVISQSEHTGSSAAVGLILRNRIDDVRSGGFVLHYRVPRYGGYKIWEGDSDGDGRLDVRGDGGDVALPVWYKIEKRGRTVRTFSSGDGQNWRLCPSYGVRELVSSSLASAQDVGVYGTAWNDRGEISRMEYSDFEVTPVAAASPAGR